MALSKEGRRLRIKRRIRKKIAGTADRPRLSVYRSNKQIYGQLINDELGVTLVAFGSDKIDTKQAKLEQAKAVGLGLAEKAKAAGFESVVFDRNGYLYHGRVQAFAEAAREGGLKF
jgi:large subunit ribosomal protein L18